MSKRSACPAKGGGDPAIAGKLFFQLKKLLKLSEHIEFTKLSEHVSSLFFYFAILIFIIGFGFRDTPTPYGWYQQFMPNLNGRQISDITFVDSLNGFAVTPYTANDTAYIVRTFNGGDNWNIIFRQPTNTVGGFNRVQFLNINTGFTCGNFLWKTTNSGINWFNVNTSGIFPMNMFVLNQDTIWLVNSDALVGGVFFTSNGGVNWIQQLSLGSANPSYIYMYNARIGFIAPSTNNGTPYTRKTTDGGQTWNIIVNGRSFVDIFFIDSLKGWSVWDSVRTTTNGGINWQTQVLPYELGISGPYPSRFSYINNDTIWLGGGRIIFPNSQGRGILYRTVNGGNNWLYQIPDTSIHGGIYSLTKFINKYTGWGNTGYVEIHTTTGGDTIFYTNIKQISSKLPDNFILFQNYPNPFNPVTKIKASLSPSKGGKQYVKLIVFDITGKKIAMLLDSQLSEGEYEVTFNGTNYSSGVYFYSLYVDGVLIATKKALLIK